MNMKHEKKQVLNDEWMIFSPFLRLICWVFWSIVGRGGFCVFKMPPPARPSAHWKWETLVALAAARGGAQSRRKLQQNKFSFYGRTSCRRVIWYPSLLRGSAAGVGLAPSTHRSRKYNVILTLPCDYNNHYLQLNFWRLETFTSMHNPFYITIILILL